MLTRGDLPVLLRSVGRGIKSTVQLVRSLKIVLFYTRKTIRSIKWIVTTIRSMI
jgi:hypothetical protein